MVFPSPPREDCGGVVHILAHKPSCEPALELRRGDAIRKIIDDKARLLGSEAVTSYDKSGEQR